jgi:acyl carrier protein
MAQSIEEKIYNIVSEVFGLPREEIDEDSSPDSIDNWDSQSHINLILSIESEFDILLEPDDAVEMLSVRLIQIILSENYIPA